MPKPPRQRRSLAYVGGAIETQGGVEAKPLAHALDVSPESDTDVARAHVHGFHTYPARLHPTTAARLIDAFTAPGERVLDPFCGSGTTLVESLILGRQSLGVDLNPLAVRLARCKIRPRTDGELDRMIAKAVTCAEFADRQRITRAGARRRFPDDDVRLFEPHVLLELGSLRDRIETLPDDATKLDLSLVFSAILVKLSRKRGDTSTQTRDRRTMPGFAARLFAEKTEELAKRLTAYQALIPTPRPKASVEQDDATELKKLKAGSVDAIITSPPYAATYDYVEHHDLRMRWLGLDASEFSAREMGARSRYRRIDPRRVRQEWSDELARFFRAAGRVLRGGGPLVLVMADSAVGDVALRADEIVADVARANGFVPVACASQRRAHFHGPSAAVFRSKPRAEHAILLRRE